MSDAYFSPDEPHYNAGVIEIPYTQQRWRGARHYFSLRIAGLCMLDMDVDMINNKRVVLTALGKLLGITGICAIKKPDLAAQIQDRFRFLAAETEKIEATAACGP
jgi:hypothetical protein